jgi:hypothetical protein
MGPAVQPLQPDAANLLAPVLEPRAPETKGTTLRPRQQLLLSNVSK